MKILLLFVCFVLFLFVRYTDGSQDLFLAFHSGISKAVLGRKPALESCKICALLAVLSLSCLLFSHFLCVSVSLSLQNLPPSPLPYKHVVMTSTSHWSPHTSLLPSSSSVVCALWHLNHGLHHKKGCNPSKTETEREDVEQQSLVHWASTSTCGSSTAALTEHPNRSCVPQPAAHSKEHLHSPMNERREPQWYHSQQGVSNWGRRV